MTAAAAAQIPMVELEGQTRGVGVLEVLGPQGRVELPLSGVTIAAKVSRFVAEVTVTQTFKNPHREHLEAEYLFPLSGGCAVGRFELRVAGRVVVGRVKERGEARRQYQEAIAQGKRAALLEQERSDVFTVKVGNLPPGEEATVLLTYSERLPFFEDCAAELRLPLVVAPRYMAGEAVARGQAGSGVESDTDKVPDASRLSPPRLAEGFDPKTSLALSVELLGEELEELSSSQHATRTSLSAGGARVSLSRVERLDRDFVLRWRVGGDQIASAVEVFEAGDGEQTALVTLVPPRREGFLGLPREVVFVLDRSGSMGGVKMTSAARACALLLRTLGPRDRFALQAFDDRVEWLQDGKRRFFQADEAGLEKGEAFLRGLDARGGTELDLAMREALLALAPAEALPIIVLLTDGQVGDESSVLKRLQTSLGEARVFTLGIDTAVNAGFLQRLAAVGGGTSTFVEPGSALEEALRAVGREIGAPLVTDLSLADEGCGLDARSLAPARVPDLFEGRAASVFVKLKKLGSLRIAGKHADGSKFSVKVKAKKLALPALAQLWAKARVTDLEDRFRLVNAGMPPEKDETAESLKAEIVRLACAHTLLTRFTAFVAIDQEVVNPGGGQRQVIQPIEMPADWEMDGAGPMPLKGPAAGGMPSLMAMAPLGLARAFAGTPVVGDASLRALAPPPPPSAPRPFPASPARAKGGLMKKMASVFGGARGAKDQGSRESEPVVRVDPAEARPVRVKLEALAQALSALERELVQGKLPAPDALEKARRELLAALGTFSQASRLLLLQRFLRTAGAELLAALRSKGSAAALGPRLAKLLLAFAAAKQEADLVLGGAPAAPGQEPWEASI